MDLTNKILRADDTVEEVTDAALAIGALGQTVQTPLIQYPGFKLYTMTEPGEDAAVNERATELYMGSAPRVRMAVIRGDAVVAG